jgi:methionine sulfoxide reductase heme-binding subunit
VGGDDGGSSVHVTSSPVDWYAARAAGIAAYVLLTAVVALGISLAARAPGRRWRRWPMFAVEDVHRVGGLLVGSFIALHVITIAIDSFLPFSLGQLAIPLTSRYRPVWTALGIVAAELLLALAVTNHYRRRIPRRWWRGAHYANFAVWIAATLHGMGSGTDRSTVWMIALDAVCVAAVAAAVTWRVGVRRGLGGVLRPSALIAAGGGAAAVVVALALGPLQAHPRPWNAPRFTDALAGRILQNTAVTRALVSMTGTATGRQNALVRADLLVGAQRLEATSFQLELLPSGLVCRGTVVSVRSFGFDAVCRLSDGSRRHVHAAWRLVDNATLRGTLTAAPIGAGAARLGTS